MELRVEREVVFPADPAEVWEALTEPDRLQEWFATEAELDPVPGGEGVFRWGDGGARVASGADRGTATATGLAAELPVTRQAVAKQLGALADAGLLRATRVGRETRYAVTPQPLGDAAAWLVEMGGRWDERLAALGRSLARARAAR